MLFLADKRVTLIRSASHPKLLPVLLPPARPMVYPFPQLSSQGKVPEHRGQVCDPPGGGQPECSGFCLPSSSPVSGPPPSVSTFCHTTTRMVGGTLRPGGVCRVVLGSSKTRDYLESEEYVCVSNQTPPGRTPAGNAGGREIREAAEPERDRRAACSRKPPRRSHSPAS